MLRVVDASILIRNLNSKRKYEETHLVVCNVVLLNNMGHPANEEDATISVPFMIDYPIFTNNTKMRR